MTLTQPIARKLSYVSASQLQAFLECPRRWYERWVLKNPAPTTPAMLRGTAIHKEIEHFLKTGEVRIDGEYIDIARAVSEALTGLGIVRDEPKIMAEQKFVLNVLDGVEWVGYVDIVDYRDSVIHIIDTKTRGDFKYNKSEAELANDLQLNSYAYWALTDARFKDHNQEMIRVSHLYALTQGVARTELVGVNISRDHVFEGFAASRKLVTEMQGYAASGHAKSDALPPNKNSCGIFGGCHYVPLCGFESPYQQLRTNNNEVITEASMDLLARIKAMNAQTETTTAVAEFDAAVPTSNFVAPRGLKDPVVHVTDTEIQVDPVAVLPPDAPPRELTESEIASLVATSTTSTGKKRGKKTTDASVTPIEHGLTLKEAPAVPLDLYIDCYPIKGKESEVVQMFDWLEGRIKPAKKDSESAIADAIKKHRAELPRIILVSSGEKESRVFIETVTPWATKVVKGLK